MKIHKTHEGEIVAICDSHLLGKVFFDGKRRLDLKSFSSFYDGKEVSESEAVEALSGAQNINLVGEKALEAAKKAGLDIRTAVKIQGVPHLQVYKLP